MSEKMLVTQALDERDLLVKKIADKIAKASFVDTIKPNEDKVFAKRIAKDEYAKEAESAYQQIVDLIRTGSLDAFLDCLDFAPVGVIDLLKKYAVSVPLADYEKRKALKEKTGFDVDAALKNIAAEKAEEEAGKNTASNTTRRIQPMDETPVTAGRRTTGSNYKVTSRAETPVSTETSAN